MKSPEFDYFNYEPILEWAEAKVEYNDKFVDGEGTVECMPEYGSYGLAWKHGYMNLDYAMHAEEAARKCAALFIYLYTRGVDCSIAIFCARLYADKVTIKRL